MININRKDYTFIWNNKLNMYIVFHHTNRIGMGRDGLACELIVDHHISETTLKHVLELRDVDSIHNFVKEAINQVADFVPDKNIFGEE